MALLLLWAPLRPLIVRALGLAPLPALLLLPAAWDGGVQLAHAAGRLDLCAGPAGRADARRLRAAVDASAALPPAAGSTGAPDQARFALWWLLTLSGSLGVFVAADLVSFYALYALASLPAYGLIVFAGGAEDRARRPHHAGGGPARRGADPCRLRAAGRRPRRGRAWPSPTRHACAAAIAPCRACVIALVVIGFGLKIGLVPLHGWMPLSYAAGPLAATAVLSGATSKAGIIGLIRFLPLDAAMPAGGRADPRGGAVLGLLWRGAGPDADQSAQRARLFEHQPARPDGGGAGSGPCRRECRGPAPSSPSTPSITCSPRAGCS